jgi:outer membrane protein OmpA-like peptidoglycan-associated protein
VTASRRFLALIAFSGWIIAVGGCSKPQTDTSGAPSASPLASAPASPEASAGSTPPPSPLASGETPTPSPSPSASASPTPVPNLLMVQNGTVLRAYPSAAPNPPALAGAGLSVDDKAAGPWVIVFELPGVATLTSLNAQVPVKTDTGQGSTVTFALSTTSATSGFSDVGTVSSVASPEPQTIALNNQRARWVRVTANRTGTAQPFNALGAFGTIAPPPANNIAGTYVQYGNPYDQGAFRTAPNESDPWYLQVVTVGKDGINGQQCFNGHLGAAYPGTIEGRTWQWKRSDDFGRYTVNDEGTLLIENEDRGSAYWVRTDQRPKFCVPQVVGSGANNVLVLESSFAGLYPINDTGIKSFPGMRFTRIGAAMADQSLLNGASTVIFNALCNADDLFAPAQNDAISQWVQNGHKLLIYDADTCGHQTHYAVLPYPFVSNNPGAHGAKGDRLILVEDDSLGTADKTDKTHFLDPIAYATGGNQLGDANTVTTHDSHWCGHLFGTNVNHVNGFMQMYAPFGKGLIVYDGFDADDGDVPSYQQVRRLELIQPVPADLPCTQKASLGFVIQPNRDASFVPGKAATKPFAMELLANQGWKGHITMTTSGDFRAAVTPSSFDVNGTTQSLKIGVTIPANAKPGTYAVIVNADGGNGETAQATIQLHAAIPLVKQIKSQRRIRIYGIHFDVDKATIKPQSEPVIAQIAQVMQQNPAWRFRVEGHTDSDGGLQHNQVLSQQRAQSVVNDLTKRYHIAKSRLVPVGYGYSKPVAPNTTSAGKALNRRVELFLLNPK